LITQVIPLPAARPESAARWPRSTGLEAVADVTVVRKLAVIASMIPQVLQVRSIRFFPFLAIS
jgi:hypothetical protein